MDAIIYGSSNCRLITEDNIQKIVSITDLLDIPFFYHTHFSSLVHYYQKEYAQEKQDQNNFENLLMEIWTNPIV